MKKTHILLSFLLCATLILSGCGEKPDKIIHSDITLRCALIGGGDYEIIYNNIEKFKKETGINVEIIYLNNHFELDKKVLQDSETNAIDYDIISNHTSFFSQYIHFLEPLDKYFLYDDIKDFLPRIINAGRSDGHLYLIPRHADISALHYRTDLFEDETHRRNFEIKYGRPLTVPATWDEFYEVAIFFGETEGIYGTQFAGKEEALTGRFYEILLANGGEFIDSDGNVAFNGPAGIKTVTMFKNLYQAGAMPEDMFDLLWDELAYNFQSGRIAMATEFYSYYSYFQYDRNSAISGKFSIARQPVGDGGIHGGWTGAHGFSITKSSQNKEAAAQLIKFLTNEENAYIEGQIGYLPVRTSVWDKLIKNAGNSSDSLAKERLELAKLQFSEDAYTPPIIPQWIPASNILYPILQDIILNEISPEEGLDMAASEIGLLLDSE